MNHPIPHDNHSGNHGGFIDTDLALQRTASATVGNHSAVRAPDNAPLTRVETPSRPGFFSRTGSLSRSSSQRHKTKPSSSAAQVPIPVPIPSSTSAAASSTPTATTPLPSSSFGSPERLPREPPTKRKGSIATHNKGKGISRLIIPNLSHSNQTTSPIEFQHPPTTPLDFSGPSWAKTPTTAGPNMESFQGYTSMSSMPPPPTTGGAFGPQSASAIYAHIHQTASKRISTLDYLRKAHEGRVYWFNTVHFSKEDLCRMSYYEQRKLSRRAINYLLLGLSLPPILDVNSTPFEYLRALNALLLEFETFQQVHPADGSGSSLARARIPHMFKRSVHSGTKGRRTSSATEIGLPIQSSDPSDIKAMTGNIATSSNPSSAATSYPSNLESSELLPGEEYTYLLTPALPFEPDFFETFSSLSDVLIDCYTRLMTLVSGPAVCTAVVGEMFTKADSRLRKVMVAGVVREFEDASRSHVKSEVAGVGKVVLGGLLG
ncbi:hypothetical protein AJ79_09025 [Helicocarpus griseus UAMH5409]|uniref:Uncharacterized protein n=1 Tax=Helicocarpus griseus UAMH5409 TaxID=1447875 RepID=A0A2B7WN68_9EURO|nr:hypothetical protein AJ79_09025 [Helicocarpus griseus UAMH5409]